MSSSEYMRDYMRRRYHARREAAIQKLGGKCVDCNSIEELEFDHVDRQSKRFSIFKQTLSEVDFWLEVEKCVLRCDTCHNRRSKEQMSVEHGGGLTGKKNCVCDLCRPLKNEYARNRKKKGR